MGEKVYKRVTSVAILHEKENTLNIPHPRYDQDIKCQVTSILLKIFLEAVDMYIMVNISATIKILTFRKQAKSIFAYGISNVEYGWI